MSSSVMVFWFLPLTMRSEPSMKTTLFLRSAALVSRKTRMQAGIEVE